MRLGYLVNQYPTTTHTFIRREIRALEELGHDIRRYSVRRWPGPLVEAADREEAPKTRVILDAGPIGLLTALISLALCRPTRMWRAFRLAWRTGKASDRGILIHTVYLAEAALLCRWMETDGVGHVHAHFGTNSASVAMLCRELGGPPYSFTAHGSSEFDRPEAISLKDKIRRASFVVAVSSFGRSQLLRWSDAGHWPKIHVVHCALEEAFFVTQMEKAPRANRMVNIGRLSEQKGQLLLVEAVARLRERGLDVPFVIIGDGPLRATLEARTRELGVSDLFELTGWLDSGRIREILLTARALVMPSFSEGLPVVIMEAMALRCPVLATRIAGIPELVVDGETGWLVCAGDVDDLTDGIHMLAEAREDVLQNVTDKAADRVRLRHNAHTEARKIASLIPSSQ